MVAFATKYAPKIEAPDAENRAWEFFLVAPETRPADRLQSAQLRREKVAFSYETASGPTNFLNRDPIGEAGGLNLYAFVGNDPVNHWDYLGLEVFRLEGRRELEFTWLEPYGGVRVHHPALIVIPYIVELDDRACEARVIIKTSEIDFEYGGFDDSFGVGVGKGLKLWAGTRRFTDLQHETTTDSHYEIGAWTVYVQRVDLEAFYFMQRTLSGKISPGYKYVDYGTYFEFNIMNRDSFDIQKSIFKSRELFDPFGLIPASE